MTYPLRYSNRLLAGLAAGAIATAGLVAGSAHVALAAPPPPGSVGDATLPVTPDPAIERVGGADRYAVSAAVSAHSFDPMIPVVYLASGEVFSDALSASAAAGAEGGAVLLTQKDSIPSVITAELRRLKPQNIVVLGGVATIGAGVETALHAFSLSVTRVAGADRFAVSAAVSARVFGSHRAVAYVASGYAFPDALSGSAAAGRLGGPVLLVGQNELPTLVADEIRRLAPAKIVVLGGTSTISDAVAAKLGSLAPTSRIDGSDRYTASAAISADAFPPNAQTVYVSSGSVFADALSGAAAAIAEAGPVLLVTSSSVPGAIGAELERLRPHHIVVLGGPASVSDATLEQLRGFVRH